MMAALARFDEISPWVTEPENPQPALRADVVADIVVIGGGYTGLSTALALREQGADVALLDAGFAGSGASGRNAGHVTPTIGKDIPTLMRLFSKERSAGLVRFADAAVDYTEHVMSHHNIDCAYNPSGNILAGVHDKHRPKLQKAADAARSLGAKVRFLSENDMADRGLPPAFRFGVLEERGGTFHPGRYVMGLRSAAIDAGIRLYENSPLTDLGDGRRIAARTAGGTIRADIAVVATNAYTTSIGFKKRQVMPLRVSMFETDPLTDTQRANLGWPGREGIYTSHEILESFHLTERNTIVGGSKFTRYRWRNGLAPGNDTEAFGIIENAFRERFPQLRDVTIATNWGGWIGFNLNFIPALGVTGSHHNIHYGIGYAGHGVTQATLMGAILADRIQGRDNQWDDLLRRRSPATPPEPLRWLIIKLLTGTFTAIDHRTDRQIRADHPQRPTQVSD